MDLNDIMKILLQINYNMIYQYICELYLETRQQSFETI